tara:strand:- start:673 stop:3042 length:2370 start_codon:yes stop_codon:yes gene_type:complete
MRSIENISEELFDKIRSRVANIKLGNSEGVVTTDPSQARFFEFNFKHRDLPMGAVTISINEEDTLKVYFPNSMVEDVDNKSADAWYGFLKELSKFSARNMLNYETHNVTKERLDKKDYQFLSQNQQDNVMENKLHGTSQKSFLEQGNAKLIIKHSRTVDETKMGARSRNISAIYIENNQGERFKFANNYLPGARAMARHVSNEGHTRDERGLHIVEIMNEMQQLKNFVRGVKHTNYDQEEAKEVIEAATDRYYGLKDTLKAISSSKGYESYFENWVPGVIDVEENDIEDLKQKLTRQVYDERITDTLPSVSRALRMAKEAKMDKDAETRSDAELDDVVAGKKTSLIDFAKSADKIELFKNPNAEMELKNYFNIMKNSDMDTKDKNRNLITNVIEYISQNVTDDAMGNALSNIDMQDNEQYKAAVMLTKKYLQGKVEMIDPAPKKDLYGKTKEDVTFENYEARMNMISEGTWALPDNENDVGKLVELMKNPVALGDAGEDATAAISFALGDDELYDDLGDAGDKDPEADARPIIIKWLEGAKDRFEAPYDEFLNMAHEQITQGPKQGELPLGDDVEVQEDDEEDRMAKTDRASVKLDDVKAGLEALLSEYTKDKDEWYSRYQEMANEIRAKQPGITDQALDDAVFDMDDDIVSYVNIDDVEDKISALQRLMKTPNADGNDIVQSAEFGVSDTVPREEFMLDMKNTIKQNHPEVYDKLFMYDVGEAQDTVQDIEEVDEVAESIAKLKAMAGVGSKARSNHGIHEGEEGYQITPRSIVARQMRKLQDIENKK